MNFSSRYQMSDLKIFSTSILSKFLLVFFKTLFSGWLIWRIFGQQKRCFYPHFRDSKQIYLVHEKCDLNILLHWCNNFEGWTNKWIRKMLLCNAKLFESLTVWLAISVKDWFDRFSRVLYVTMSQSFWKIFIKNYL